MWDYFLGDGEVVCKTESEVKVLFKDLQRRTYKFDGAWFGWTNRTLFWSEIKFDPPPRPKRKVKRKVEAWAIFEDGYKTLVWVEPHLLRGETKVRLTGEREVVE